MTQLSLLDERGDALTQGRCTYPGCLATATHAAEARWSRGVTPSWCTDGPPVPYQQAPTSGFVRRACCRTHANYYATAWAPIYPGQNDTAWVALLPGTEWGTP